MMCVTPAARQAAMIARSFAGRMSPKRHGGAGAGACAKHEQFCRAEQEITGSRERSGMDSWAQSVARFGAKSLARVVL